MAAETNTKEKKIVTLVVDPEKPLQKIALISMVRPQNDEIIRKKEKFYALKFLEHHLKEFADAYQYVRSKVKDEITPLTDEKLNLTFDNISQLYDDFQRYSEKHLDAEFNASFNPTNEISICGLKIRGVYENEAAMKNDLDILRSIEPFVDIWSLPIGRWVPFCPMNEMEFDSQFANEKLQNVMVATNRTWRDQQKAFQKRLEAEANAPIY